MSQQITALQRMEGRRYFGLLMEQGTGKTWALLADAERLFLQGKIEAVLVIAPNGVHTNWVYREIPTHIGGRVLARAWLSGSGVRATKYMDEVFAPSDDGEPPPLRILAMNIDALIHKRGYAYALKFLTTYKTMIVLDESSDIKSPETARTKAMMLLRSRAVAARIANGTPITKAPLDVFAQMEFLRTGLMGTTSYRAFVSEYAVLLDPNSRQMQNLIAENPRAQFAQIIARNVDGTPMWRNLDKLKALLEPHTYRVTKRECLDLPEKIYQNHFFELDPKQQRAYDLMSDLNRIEVPDSLDALSVSALAALGKLRQITSGFVIKPDGGGVHYVSDGNPRLAALRTLVAANDAPVIVWAYFQEELTAIAALLRAMGRRVVEYRGETRRTDREEAVDAFQRGDADAFVGHPQAGGIGLTLTAAQWVVYYSNSFNLRHRLQSEDRAHRIGTTGNVVYIDIVALGTVDVAMARSLQAKMITASIVLGDDARPIPSENTLCAPGPSGAVDRLEK